MPLPPIEDTGDLPQGLHCAQLHEVMRQFGHPTTQRKVVAMRLSRVYELAAATSHVKRFIVFGSFVSAKPEPNDVDVFLFMDDPFDLSQVVGEARLVFDHPAAQTYFEASVFWLRQLAAVPSEKDMVEGWQLTRDGTRKDIVEVTEA